MSNSVQYSQGIIHLVILFAIGIIWGLGSWFFINFQQIYIQDPQSREVAEKSLRYFDETRRCGVAECLDHFQVTRVTRLTYPVRLTNTGGGRMGPPSPLPTAKERESAAKKGIVYSTSSKLGIIQSTKMLEDPQYKYRYYVCQKGDYLINISYRNIFLWKVDSLELCYQIGA